MSSEIMNERNKSKWLAGFNLVAVSLSAYTSYRLLTYVMNLWQPAMSDFTRSAVLFVLSLLAGVLTYFFVLRRKDLSTYIEESYEELTHIIFPDNALTLRLGAVILVFVVVLGFVFFIVDGISARLLFWLASL